ncbi:aldehyde dehydrogenase family protein, partial [Brevibacillus agri]
MHTMQKSLFINGEWVKAGQYTELRSPYSGEALAEIPAANEEETKQAIAAAYAAKAIMAKMPAHRRAAILESLVSLLRERSEEAATIIAQEAAKPIAVARGEVARTIE